MYLVATQEILLLLLLVVVVVVVVVVVLLLYNYKNHNMRLDKIDVNFVETQESASRNTVYSCLCVFGTFLLL